MGMLARLGVVLGLDSAEFQKNLDSAGSQLDRFTRKAGNVASALAAGFSAAVIGAAIKNVVDGLDALNDAADATGASVDKLAGLEKIAGQTGNQFDAVTGAIVKLNKALNDSDAVDSKSRIAFNALGLEVDKLKKMDPADMFFAVSQAIYRLADDGSKARVEMMLFGKGMRDIAPVVKDIGEKTGDFSLSMSEAAQQAETFNRNVGKLTYMMKEFARDALMPVIGALTDLFSPDDINDFQRQLGRALQQLAEYQKLGIDQADGRMKRVIERIAELQIKIKELQPPSAQQEKKSIEEDLAAAEARAAAAKKLEEARKKAAAAAEAQAKAEKKLAEDIRNDIADQQLMLELVGRGMEVEEARTRVQLARKHATGEQIDEMARLQHAMDGVIEGRKELQKIEEKELKDKQAVERVRQISAEYERQQQFQLNQLRIRGELMQLTEKERQVEESVLAIRNQTNQQLQDVQDKITEAILKRELTLAAALETQKELIAERGRAFEEETRAIIEQQQAMQNSFEFGWRKAYRQYAEDAQNYARLGQQYFETMANAMTSAIDQFVNTGKLSFSDFARSVIKDLIRIQLQMQAMQLFNMAKGFLGGLFGGASAGPEVTNYAGGTTTFFGKATGGFLDGPAMVGENGPELFIPNRPGNIIPNGQLSSFMQPQPQVVYNGPYIQNMSAIDTQSASQFLSKNKLAVYAANQSASRSIPTSR